MTSSTDLEFEALLARRRAENAREVRRRWLMVAVVAAIPLLFGAVAAVRSVAKDTKEWSHTEMAEYLKIRGVRVIVMPAGGRDAYYRDADSWGEVTVRIVGSDFQAKEIASASPNERFAFGRFVFIGDGKFFNRLKSAVQ